jgi:restriction endonuclease S subunit
LKVEDYAANGIPLVRVSNCRTGHIEKNAELVYISPEKHQELIRSEVLPGDVLLTKAGHILGYSAVFPPELVRGNITSHLVTIRPSANVLPDFLSTYLSSIRQIYRWGNKATRPELNTDEVREILVPLPPLDIQKKLVDEMEVARESRKKKLQQADELLGGLDAWLYTKLGLRSSGSTGRTIFAVRYRHLQGPLNPERYSSTQTQKQVSGTTVGQICKILTEKMSPSKVAPTALWDRIRIDDLPNQPLQVDTLNSNIGAEIDGSFFVVQENDILLARLGPTIQNAKFVLCPPLKRQTVASAEFLVLRCKKGLNPEVILWILRSRLFRDIMYSLCRGGTPSRYRLNADDLAQMPFPIISDKMQPDIATEVRHRREEARRLRAEAEAEWQAAKKSFEDQLLGGTVQP